MKKVIKLNENDIKRLVKKIIREESHFTYDYGQEEIKTGNDLAVPEISFTMESKKELRVLSMLLLSVTLLIPLISMRITHPPIMRTARAPINFGP